MDFLISENNFEKARKKIRENKEKTIIFSGDDETNRKVLEKEQINILLLNQKQRKDRQKQRDSGFNQVLAKLAKKKNVIIGINLDEIIESNGKKREEILARIRQNIKLCNKNNLKMKFININPANKRDKYDLKALGIILGMPTKIVKTL
jgi:RNase P/RNase MRP subunit p30